MGGKESKTKGSYYPAKEQDQPKKNNKGKGKYLQQSSSMPGSVTDLTNAGRKHKGKHGGEQNASFRSSSAGISGMFTASGCTANNSELDDTDEVDLDMGGYSQIQLKGNSPNVANNAYADNGDRGSISEGATSDYDSTNRSDTESIHINTGGIDRSKLSQVEEISDPTYASVIKPKNSHDAMSKEKSNVREPDEDSDDYSNSTTSSSEESNTVETDHQENNLEPSSQLMVLRNTHYSQTSLEKCVNNDTIHQHHVENNQGIIGVKRKVKSHETDTQIEVSNKVVHESEKSLSIGNELELDEDSQSDSDTSSSLSHKENIADWVKPGNKKYDQNIHDTPKMGLFNVRYTKQDVEASSLGSNREDEDYSDVENDSIVEPPEYNFEGNTVKHIIGDDNDNRMLQYVSELQINMDDESSHSKSETELRETNHEEHKVDANFSKSESNLDNTSVQQTDNLPQRRASLLDKLKSRRRRKNLYQTPLAATTKYGRSMSVPEMPTTDVGMLEKDKKKSSSITSRLFGSGRRSPKTVTTPTGSLNEYDMSTPQEVESLPSSRSGTPRGSMLSFPLNIKKRFSRFSSDEPVDPIPMNISEPVLVKSTRDLSKYLGGRHVELDGLSPRTDTSLQDDGFDEDDDESNNENIFIDTKLKTNKLQEENDDCLPSYDLDSQPQEFKQEITTIEEENVITSSNSEDNINRAAEKERVYETLRKDYKIENDSNSHSILGIVHERIRIKSESKSSDSLENCGISESKENVSLARPLPILPSKNMKDDIKNITEQAKVTQCTTLNGEVIPIDSSLVTKYDNGTFTTLSYPQVKHDVCVHNASENISYTEQGNVDRGELYADIPIEDESEHMLKVSRSHSLPGPLNQESPLTQVYSVSSEDINVNIVQNNGSTPSEVNFDAIHWPSIESFQSSSNSAFSPYEAKVRELSVVPVEHIPNFSGSKLRNNSCDKPVEMKEEGMFISNFEISSKRNIQDVITSPVKNISKALSFSSKEGSDTIKAESNTNDEIASFIEDNEVFDVKSVSEDSAVPKSTDSESDSTEIKEKDSIEFHEQNFEICENDFVEKWVSEVNSYQTSEMDKPDPISTDEESGRKHSKRISYSNFGDDEKSSDCESGSEHTLPSVLEMTTLTGDATPDTKSLSLSTPVMYKQTSENNYEEIVYAPASVSSIGTFRDFKYIKKEDGRISFVDMPYKVVEFNKIEKGDGKEEVTQEKVVVPKLKMTDIDSTSSSASSDVHYSSVLKKNLSASLPHLPGTSADRSNDHQKPVQLKNAEDILKYSMVKDSSNTTNKKGSYSRSLSEALQTWLNWGSSRIRKSIHWGSKKLQIGRTKSEFDERNDESIDRPSFVQERSWRNAGNLKRAMSNVEVYSRKIDEYDSSSCVDSDIQQRERKINVIHQKPEGQGLEIINKGIEKQDSFSEDQISSSHLETVSDSELEIHGSTNISCQTKGKRKKLQVIEKTPDGRYTFDPTSPRKAEMRKKGGIPPPRPASLPVRRKMYPSVHSNEDVNRKNTLGSNTASVPVKDVFETERSYFNRAWSSSFRSRSRSSSRKYSRKGAQIKRASSFNGHSSANIKDKSTLETYSLNRVHSCSDSSLVIRRSKSAQIEIKNKLLRTESWASEEDKNLLEQVEKIAEGKYKSEFQSPRINEIMTEKKLRPPRPASLPIKRKVFANQENGVTRSETQKYPPSYQVKEKSNFLKDAKDEILVSSVSSESLSDEYKESVGTDSQPHWHDITNSQRSDDTVEINKFVPSIPIEIKKSVPPVPPPRRKMMKQKSIISMSWADDDEINEEVKFEIGSESSKTSLNEQDPTQITERPKDKVLEKVDIVVHNEAKPNKECKFVQEHQQANHSELTEDKLSNTEAVDACKITVNNSLHESLNTEITDQKQATFVEICQFNEVKDDLNQSVNKKEQYKKSEVGEITSDVNKTTEMMPIVKPKRPASVPIRKGSEKLDMKPNPNKMELKLEKVKQTVDTILVQKDMGEKSKVSKPKNELQKAFQGESQIALTSKKNLDNSKTEKYADLKDKNESPDVSQVQSKTISKASKKRPNKKTNDLKGKIEISKKRSDPSNMKTVARQPPDGMSHEGDEEPVKVKRRLTGLTVPVVRHRKSKQDEDSLSVDSIPVTNRPRNRIPLRIKRKYPDYFSIPDDIDCSDSDLSDTQNMEGYHPAGIFEHVAKMSRIVDIPAASGSIVQTVLPVKIRSDVVGGTSYPYNNTVHPHAMTSLRLQSDTTEIQHTPLDIPVNSPNDQFGPNTERRLQEEKQLIKQTMERRDSQVNDSGSNKENTDTTLTPESKHKKKKRHKERTRDSDNESRHHHHKHRKSKKHHRHRSRSRERSRKEKSRSRSPPFEREEEVPASARDLSRKLETQEHSKSGRDLNQRYENDHDKDSKHKGRKEKDKHKDKKRSRSSSHRRRSERKHSDLDRSFLSENGGNGGRNMRAVPRRRRSLSSMPPRNQDLFHLLQNQQLEEQYNLEAKMAAKLIINDAYLSTKDWRKKEQQKVREILDQAYPFSSKDSARSKYSAAASTSLPPMSPTPSSQAGSEPARRPPGRRSRQDSTSPRPGSALEMLLTKGSLVNNRPEQFKQRQSHPQHQSAPPLSSRFIQQPLTHRAWTNPQSVNSIEKDQLLRAIRDEMKNLQPYGPVKAH